jgi:acetoin utilization deacetylase AcuC-like enzyme
MSGGRLVPHVEVPDRADRVLDAVVAAGLGPVHEVSVDERAVRAIAERLHEPAMLDFLATAWERWSAAGHEVDALPMVWPMPALRFSGPDGTRRPDDVQGQLACWCFDAGTPVGPGTWPAAVASAGCALAAADGLAADAAAGPTFALCRPPGHHAAPGAFGGYCYLNNSAIAAQRLLDRGSSPVAVLDVDYHHGNGTQAVFWERPDVLTVSIHADPRQAYPYFSGYAPEVGAGPGTGANLNLPLPDGTGWPDYAAALDTALAAITAFRPAALVVALGVDTHAADPISGFDLVAGDYARIGTRIGALGLPSVVVLEGGYALDEIGPTVVELLAALTGADLPT